jgi:hypothetical protein
MKLNKYYVTFIGHPNSYTIEALNEGDAWLRALAYSGLKGDIKGYAELLQTRRI